MRVTTISTMLLAVCILLAALQPAAEPDPQFQDVTVEAGIQFVHASRHTPDKYLIETMGSGVAALDYDRDGLLDLLFLNGAQVIKSDSGQVRLDKQDSKYWNRLYRNNGNGKWADVTESMGIMGSTFAMGAAVGDFDNDGWPDIYITGYGRNTLYRNDRGRKFVDVTATAGVQGDGWSTGAAFVDYDRDGRLDLFVARYLQWSFASNPWCGPRELEQRAYCHPNTFPDVTHILYRNIGDGRFENVTGRSGIAQHPGKGLGVAVADVDLDGWMDIVVANDSVAQQLFRNRGDGGFEEVALEKGIAYDGDGKAFAGMGVDIADIDNDGHPEIFINALSLEGYALFRTDGFGSFESISEQTGLSAFSRPFSGWGARFADFDNDGWKDLVVAQGHVMDTIHYSLPQISYQQPLLLLRNLGNRFLDKSQSSGPAFQAKRAARGAVVADLNNDGRLDIVVSGNDEQALLLLNNTEAGNWLIIDAVGSQSNRDAIGALVHIVDDSGREQWQAVTTASSYLSASDKRAHFGLGSAERVQLLKIRWPSGRRQELKGISANQILTVREPE